MALKIIDELTFLSVFLERLPKDRGEKRKWGEGVIFGAKFVTLSIARLLEDKRKEQLYEKLLQWEKEEKKLFGKKCYRLLQNDRLGNTVGDSTTKKK